MTPSYFILFLLAAGMNAAAHLLLKRGSLLLEPILSGSDSLVIKLVRVATNPFIVIAIVLLGSGMLLWINIISKVELSRAYPINIALTIMIISFVSLFLFQETMTWPKAVGIVLIIVGIWSVVSS